MLIPYSNVTVELSKERRLSEAVSRVEIAEAVREAFDSSGAYRGEIIATAEGNGARPVVVAALGRLEDRRYGRLNDLWEVLHEVPVEV
jgi:hypothetical protein